MVYLSSIGVCTHKKIRIQMPLLQEHYSVCTVTGFKFRVFNLLRYAYMKTHTCPTNEKYYLFLSTELKYGWHGDEPYINHALFSVLNFNVFNIL